VGRRLLTASSFYRQGSILNHIRSVDRAAKKFGRDLIPDAHGQHGRVSIADSSRRLLLDRRPPGPGHDPGHPPRVEGDEPGRDEHLDHPVDRTLGTARTDAPAELAALAADGVLKVATLRRGHRTSLLALDDEVRRERTEPVFERRRHQRQAEEELEGRA